MAEEETLPNFNLQVTQRNISTTVPEGYLSPYYTYVECNDDEVVTGGGFQWDNNAEANNYNEPLIVRENRMVEDSYWQVVWEPPIPPGAVLIVYAECLKVVNEGATTG